MPNNLRLFTGYLLEELATMTTDAAGRDLMMTFIAEAMIDCHHAARAAV